MWLVVWRSGELAVSWLDGQMVKFNGFDLIYVRYDQELEDFNPAMNKNRF